MASRLVMRHHCFFWIGFFPVDCGTTGPGWQVTLTVTVNEALVGFRCKKIGKSFAPHSFSGILTQKDSLTPQDSYHQYCCL